MDRFTSNLLTFSFICSGLRVKFINPPKFPCDIEITVRRPTNRKFCTPSVSSVAGPFTKFSVPNVPNRSGISAIDTSTTTWRNSSIRYRESERFISAKKDAVHPAPSPYNMLSVQSKLSSPFLFCVQKASRVTWHTLLTNSADFSSALSCQRTRLPFHSIARGRLCSTRLVLQCYQSGFHRWLIWPDR